MGEMNRKDLMGKLLNRAQLNGFEFRRWFVEIVEPTWPGVDEALTLLSGEGRHYALLFSHEFAQHFWQAGSQIRFTVPAKTYYRVTGQGDVVEVTRKPFTRRTVKPGVWKYHIRQMATADDPIEYLCRFLSPQDQAKISNPDQEPEAVQD
jgi:hypothetical protein